MKLVFEGFEFGADASVEVVIEDERGHALRISAHEALELMELFANNVEWLEQIRDEEKKKKRKR
jgi:coenzyme F420-reducing hydrogenase delta subunit